MNYKILLVEHRQDVLELFQQIEWGEEFSVEICSSGKEALAWLEEQTAQLIYVGDQLPEMDCVEFRYNKAQLSRAEHIPVVVLSEVQDYKLRLLQLEEGFDDYILVPFDPLEVEARARILLRELFDIARISKTKARGFSGRLNEMNLLDLLQTLELGRKSGVIRLNRGIENARVFVKNGQVVDAETQSLIGEEALFSLFTWDDGVFVVDFQEIDREKQLQIPTQEIMLRGLKILEEWETLRAEFPNRSIILRRNESARREDFNPEWDEIYSLIDGKRNLRRILEISPYNEIRTLSILRQLRIIGLVIEEREPAERESFLEEEFFQLQRSIISDVHLKNVIDYYISCLMRRRSFEKQIKTLYPAAEVPVQEKCVPDHKLGKMELQYIKRKLL